MIDLERCRQLVEAAVAVHGPARPIEPLSDETVVAILDLARAAAHGVERKAAPLVSFMVGLALADAAPEARLAALRDAAAAIDAAVDEGS